MEGGLSAIKWVSVAKLVVQAARWLVTLTAIRLLAPEDHGLVASVSVVTGIVSVFAELGLSASLVQSSELSHGEIRRVNGLCWMLGFTATSAVIGLGPMTAWVFYGERLLAIAAACALHFLMGGFASVPGTLATRSMAFKKRLVAIETAAGIVAAFCTLPLAWRGFDFWALVVCALLVKLIRTTSFFVLNPAPSPGFAFHGLKRFFLGGTLLLNRVVYQVVPQADVAIASRMLSKSNVGHYAVAYQIARSGISLMTLAGVHVGSAVALTAQRATPAAGPLCRASDALQ